MLSRQPFSEPRPPYNRPRSDSNNNGSTNNSAGGEPSVITYSRGLPSYGNPNQFPNPPQHYFPSIPASQRQRRLRSPEPPSSAYRDYESSTSAQQQQQQQRGASIPPGVKHRKSEADWESLNGGTAESESGDWDKEDADMDDGDDGRDANGDRDESGPAKKRSRTLTTAHQTAVLNALLSKTRFPSTETREEVGQQIGMSARRVQIWFQNRRQSQKRARDRDVNDNGGPMSPGHHHQDYLGADPYAANRYSSRPLSSAPYPSLSRQPSNESINSLASYSSAQTSLSANRRASHYAPYPPPPPQQQQPQSQWTSNGSMRTYAFPPPPSRSDPRGGKDPTRRYTSPEPEFRLPPLAAVLGGNVPPPASSSSSSANRQSSYLPSQQQQQQLSHDQQLQREQQRYQQQLLNHQQQQQQLREIPRPESPSQLIFSHRPPPLPTPAPRPSSSFISSDQPFPSLAASSSNTMPRYDQRFEGTEFSRLRISNPPSIHSNGTGGGGESVLDSSPSPEGQSPPDILDDAMEMMYRSSRANPSRSSLPPLRSTFTKDIRRMQPLPARPASEADAALLAPILKTGNNTFGGPGTKLPPMRLPPLSSLSLAPSETASSNSSTSTILPNGSSPYQQPYPSPTASISPPHHPPFPPRSFSHTSSRSSISSAAGVGSGGISGSNGGSGPARSSISSLETSTSSWAPSLTSSRTSFSSEVQEEWDRASAALGGGMSLGSRKANLVVREGSWEEESNNGRLRTPEEVGAISAGSS